ncbi:MAG: glycoside hydrolase family 13 protein [Bacteroidetes bacterium]|nr:glycoside hydrolase family 13 protein [Bacteroidota bacterium]MBS1541457.1 glycoside hydrolase family 13 protein [Bacteroidota bacterium]
MAKRIVWILLFALPFAGEAQKKSKPVFDRIEPAFWWVGMKNKELQILFYNKDTNIGDYDASLTYAGVSIKEKIKVENPHYLFLTLQIGEQAKAGSVPIQFKSGKKNFSVLYELKNKATAKNRIQGFNASDVLYLIMPDRFANGDVKNDSLPGFYQGVHRDQPFGRHGGDLKGIADHLDFIADLGVTTLWLNPILENNQKRESYHGYAITDFYKVDARFGSNEEYVALIEKCHARGIKMVQDMVINHMGNFNWLMLDLPEKNWVHQFPEFTRSNYRSEVVSDPYQSKEDLNKMTNGWFDYTMPDINQNNPLFANFLIQNTLWWIEYAGIDGIRMDTYPYPDRDFMARWAQEVLAEYPQFNIVGEVLVNSKPMVGYWQQGAANRDGYQSHLPSVIDFPLTNAINAGLNEKGSWDGGLARLYTTLSHDFIYPDANNNVTFLDNHDMSRYFHNMGRDMNKFKMGLVFLLTTRGIPQLYYGTELLMDGNYSIHPTVRMDVPGGWAEDKVNQFVRTGRSKEQNEAYDFMSKLLQWRKTKTVIHQGKLTHFIPEDNVYVYFRTKESETVMVLMNGNDHDMKVNTARFSECMKGKTSAQNVLTGETTQNMKEIMLPAMAAIILELK